ncbi:hypothetical protein ACFC0X_12745 [Paenibacillus chitinolyticus]
MQELAEGNRSGAARMHIVTKAKANAVVYEKPVSHPDEVAGM